MVGKYAKSWSLLLKYDEDRLELPKDRHPIKKSLQYGKAIEAILALKNELMERLLKWEIETESFIPKIKGF